MRLSALHLLSQLLQPTSATLAIGTSAEPTPILGLLALLARTILGLAPIVLRSLASNGVGQYKQGQESTSSNAQGTPQAEPPLFPRQ